MLSFGSSTRRVPTIRYQPGRALFDMERKLVIHIGSHIPSPEPSVAPPVGLCAMCYAGRLVACKTRLTDCTSCNQLPDCDASCVRPTGVSW